MAASLKLLLLLLTTQDSGDEFAAGLTFAPKDVAPLDFQGKDDVHGLGYSGINPRAALGGGTAGAGRGGSSTSTRFTLFDEPSVTKTGKKGIRGHVSFIIIIFVFTITMCRTVGELLILYTVHHSYLHLILCCVR